MTSAAGTQQPVGILLRIWSRLRAGFLLLRRKPRRAVRRLDHKALLTRLGILLAVFLLMSALLDVSAITAAKKTPEWLAHIFDFITDFGKGAVFLYPLAFAIVLLAIVPPTLPRVPQIVLMSIAMRLTFLFAAIAIPGLFTAIVKRFIGRARPFVGGAPDAYLYRPFEGSAAYASLPSGHATTAFAAATAIALLCPSWRPLLIAYAIAVAISRVVLMAHHPSDVLAGAFVGIAGALLIRNYFAARTLVFGIKEDGQVGVFAGPSRRRVKSVARALLAD